MKRRNALFRYEIVQAWGQLPDGVGVGVVIADAYQGKTIEWAIWDPETGDTTAAWTARLIGPAGQA